MMEISITLRKAEWKMKNDFKVISKKQKTTGTVLPGNAEPFNVTTSYFLILSFEGKKRKANVSPMVYEKVQEGDIVFGSI